MVLEYVQAHGRIERKHVIELFGISSEQAGRLLSRMCEKGKLYRRGTPVTLWVSDAWIEHVYRLSSGISYPF